MGKPSQKFFDRMAQVVLKPVLQKYSDDQPRDFHGRFASVDGSGDSTSLKGVAEDKAVPLTAKGWVEITRGQKMENAQIRQMMKDLTTTWPKPQFGTPEWDKFVQKYKDLYNGSVAKDSFMVRGGVDKYVSTGNERDFYLKTVDAVSVITGDKIPILPMGGKDDFVRVTVDNSLLENGDVTAKELNSFLDKIATLDSYAPLKEGETGNIRLSTTLDDKTGGLTQFFTSPTQTTPFSLRLDVNGKLASSGGVMAQTIQTNTNPEGVTPWFAPGADKFSSNIDYTLTHEWGHMVYASHFDYLESKIPAIYDLYQAKPESTDSVGHYTMRNYKEFFAEAFANTVLSENTKTEPLFPEVSKIIKDIYGPNIGKIGV
jgi:hypothetical protein